MTGSIMALTARDCLPPPPAALRAAARRRYAALRATLGAALRAAQNVPNTENAPLLLIADTARKSARVPKYEV